MPTTSEPHTCIAPVLHEMPACLGSYAQMRPLLCRKRELLGCRKFYVGGGNPDDFYTSASARQAFKNHMKTVVSRKNTITGIVSGP